MPRQQVQDGRGAGGDVEFAGVEARAPVRGRRTSRPSSPSTSGRASAYSASPSRVGEQPAAAALEQPHPELALQRLQLQGHRRLAEVQRLGRARHRAQPRDLAERPQRLQAVGLVGEAGGGRVALGHGLASFIS